MYQAVTGNAARDGQAAHSMSVGSFRADDLNSPVAQILDEALSNKRLVECIGRVDGIFLSE